MSSSFGKSLMSLKNDKKNDLATLFMGKSFFSKGIDRLLVSLESKVIETTKPLVIFTPNPEQIVLASQKPEFSANLDQANILLPDGIGVVLASKLLGVIKGQPSISQRIAGVDVVQELLRLSSQKKWSVLLLGGKDYADHLAEIQVQGISQQTQLSLQWLAGYDFVETPTIEEEKIVAQTLKQQKPQVVFVAFGAPWQEKWVVEHLELLKQSGVEIVMVVGGAFDMLLGKVIRAPFIVRALGLEWLFRLVQEPWRWKRQLKLITFMGLVLREIFVGKRAGEQTGKLGK